jgi:hypothetical protein
MFFTELMKTEHQMYIQVHNYQTSQAIKPTAGEAALEARKYVPQS